MQIAVVAIFVFFSKEALAADAINPRIIGGNPANIYAFPFSAAIDVQTSNSNFFCGGALYTNLFVITAGQCVDGAILFTVHLGSSTLGDSNSVTVATSEYFLHPDYNQTTLDNDIGLIKFRMPVEFTDILKSIGHLALEPLPDARGVRAIGWGQTSDEDAELSVHLHWVSLITLTNAECRLTYGSQIADKMVCAEGNYNEGACYGDIGGPLIDYDSSHQTIHVGVSSFLSGNGCESTDPSGYTRTYPNVEWIQNITASALKMD